MSYKVNKMVKSKWKTHVNQLIVLATTLNNDRKLEEAINSYEAAYQFIPDPKEASELTTFVLRNIGEIHFVQSQWELAFKDFSNAVKCKGGLGNPHIHLRLGQLQFERDNMERAKDELMRAYMGAGKSYFENEDPKYFSLIQDLL